ATSGASPERREARFALAHHREPCHPPRAKRFQKVPEASYRRIAGQIRSRSMPAFAAVSLPGWLNRGSPSHRTSNSITHWCHVVNWLRRKPLGGPRREPESVPFVQHIFENVPNEL